MLYGPTATGKTSIARDVLQVLNTPHTLVDSAECITGRHLFERTAAACLDAFGDKDAIQGDNDRYARTESLSALKVSLERILRNRGKFVLVFDGIDRQKEAPPGLMAALARFGDHIPSLSVVFITRDPLPIELHQTGIAHMAFPAYEREEALEILGQWPLRTNLVQAGAEPESHDTGPGADDIWLWTRFCEAVWDSQAKFAGRDIVSFEAITRKLWQPFVTPIINGIYGPRDFSKLIVARRMLFQSEDMLHEEVVYARSSSPSVEKALAAQPHEPQIRKAPRRTAIYEMPYYSKYLLCAAYLASYHTPRTDSIYFMKAAERKRRRRGGGAKVGRKPIHRKVRMLYFLY